MWKSKRRKVEHAKLKLERSVSEEDRLYGKPDNHGRRHPRQQKWPGQWIQTGEASGPTKARG